MTEAGTARVADEEVTQPLFNVQRLTNHWARPASPRTYYWFLTFDNQPALHRLVQRCQASLAFPHYDLTAPNALHMTLERIAFEGEISQNQLTAVRAAAARACSAIAPIEFTVGRIGGTPGAIGFSAYPAGPIRELRNALRTATQLAYPDARLRPPDLTPHVTIAYCNDADAPTTPTVDAVRALRGDATRLTVTAVSLVLLERLPRAYTWQTIGHLHLSA